MTRDEAAEALALLVDVFGLPRYTRLEWNTRTRRGRAFPERWRIIIGPKCWRSTEVSLLHEVAHLVVHREHGRVARGSTRDWHGPRFVAVLARVARAWYGDPRRYPWASEYPTVRKRSEKELG